MSGPTSAMRVTARAAVLALLLAIPVTASTANALATTASAAGTTTVYLPNVTKMLGGDDGWQTPFIVQNVGGLTTDVQMDFYSFAGALVKTRYVSGLAAGTSVYHDPNHDPELPAGGQFSVVVTSTAAPVVVVVNEHQNVTNQIRQEALSYAGISRGSTKVFLPYVADQVNGWLTTMVIQNVGAVSASVSARFTSFDGTKTATITRTITAGRSQFIDPRVEASLFPGTEYAVAITSDQPVGAVVNAHNDAPNAVAPMGFSYNGALPSDDPQSWAPYAARNVNGMSSRLIVQNMGLTPQTPTLFFRAFGQSNPLGIAAPAAISPGASWSYDLRQSVLPDGEYSVHLTGGQFAIASATTSATSAMGYTGYAGGSSLFYLPNVTRTLGGADGWTTPIIIQSMAGYSSAVRLNWYRFSDGALVTSQTVGPLTYGTSVRVDPRLVPGLADNTQYAVVVEAPFAPVAVIETELNFQGGDGAMAFEAFEPAPAAGFGTTSCTPSTAPAGTTFICRFYGLTPGASPITFTRTSGSTTFSPTTYNTPIPADGSFSMYYRTSTVGTQTLSASAGGKTATTSINVSVPDFVVAITQATNGSVTANTKPGAFCLAYIVLSDNSYATANGPQLPRVADANGNVTWSYTAFASPPGSSSVTVLCAVNQRTLAARTTFTVP